MALPDHAQSILTYDYPYLAVSDAGMLARQVKCQCSPGTNRIFLSGLYIPWVRPAASHVFLTRQETWPVQDDAHTSDFSIAQCVTLKFECSSCHDRMGYPAGAGGGFWAVQGDGSWPAPDHVRHAPLLAGSGGPQAGAILAACRCLLIWHRHVGNSHPSGALGR